MTLKLLPSRPAKLATIVSPLSHRSVRTSAFGLFSGSGSANAGGTTAKDATRPTRKRRRSGMVPSFRGEPSLFAPDLPRQGHWLGRLLQRGESAGELEPASAIAARAKRHSVRRRSQLVAGTSSRP